MIAIIFIHIKIVDGQRIYMIVLCVVRKLAPKIKVMPLPGKNKALEDFLIRLLSTNPAFGSGVSPGSLSFGKCKGNILIDKSIE